MAIVRVSDAQSFALLTERAGRLLSTIDNLQQQIASGKRLVDPADDPLGAAQVVRHESDLAALAQYAASSSFGSNVLGVQDSVLGDATSVLQRAEEIATEQASSLNDQGRATAIQEVHGLLQSLTVDGNTQFAGRSVWGGLSASTTPPFADPDSPGYSAAAAFTGSTNQLEIKLGPNASERVRLTTSGGQVFGPALQALEALETALRTGGDVSATLGGLAQARDTLIAERASVGTRETQLQERSTQVAAQTNRVQGALSSVQDADAVAVITQLTQTQQALQAVLAAGARVAQTNLVDLLKI